MVLIGATLSAVLTVRFWAYLCLAGHILLTSHISRVYVFFYVLLLCSHSSCCFYIVLYFIFAWLRFVLVLIPLATVRVLVTLSPISAAE